jgi:glycine betaine/proline transport system substrate-binding protein
MIGLVAALLAVLLWSSKPFLVLATNEALTPGQVFLFSATLSVLSSFVPAFLARRWIMDVIVMVRARELLLLATCAAIPLSIWYWAFYHALSAGAPAEAVVISFTWPLIAILAMRLFAKGEQRPLRLTEYPLLLLAFLGAAVTAYGAEGADGLVGYAVLAAVGSGLYLPFMVRLIRSLSRAGAGPVLSSFLAVASVNALTVPIAIVLLLMSGERVSPAREVTPGVILAVAMIGVGIFLISEMLWSWGVMKNGSPAIAALPYLTPFISTLLLALLGLQQPGPHVMIGAGMVLTANLLLHVRHRKGRQSEKVRFTVFRFRDKRS